MHGVDKLESCWASTFLMQMDQFVECELGDGPQTPRDVSTAAAGAHCYIMEKARASHAQQLTC